MSTDDTNPPQSPESDAPGTRAAHSGDSGTTGPSQPGATPEPMVCPMRMASGAPLGAYYGEVPPPQPRPPQRQPSQPQPPQPQQPRHVAPKPQPSTQTPSETPGPAPAASSSSHPAVVLEAYVVSATDGWSLEPASGRREWMDQTSDKFAYRCLPLVMANQVGWVLSCPLNFRALWNGRPDRLGTVLTFPEGEGRNRNQIRSHFGHGIVTFSLPWLFRTSPGYGLWVRGPSNYVKDNLTALDGIVETDWAPYTFTMNWKIQRPGTEVTFTKGEPICMIVPFPLALPEAVAPVFKQLRDDPSFAADFQDFVRRRDANLQKLAMTRQSSFQMDYMRGHKPDGTPVSEHRKAFKLREFDAPDAGRTDLPRRD